MTTKPIRLMPDRVNLGSYMASTMAHPMGFRSERAYDGPMGFNVPRWQRPLVWTEAQKIALIESAWLGINIGTFTYNEAYGTPLDLLLIDGLQRMSAISDYLDDAFPVFGHRWSELGAVDRRRWSMSTQFPCYVTRTTDEEYIKSYYKLMNFGGTPHTERDFSRLIDAPPLSQPKE